MKKERNAPKERKTRTAEFFRRKIPVYSYSLFTNHYLQSAPTSILPHKGGRVFIVDSCAKLGKGKIIGHLLTSRQAKRSRMGVSVKKSVIPGADPESINVYLSNG